MTIVNERIMMIEGVKRRRSSFLFSMATGPTPKNTVGPRAGTTQTLSIESVSL